ncbi:family 20 glycosylhydrolase, partial [Stenotrophomonas maltophilia]|uniref:family 20 glycosylhydrolase n=1 Tax=Stenotrophomonas maltophilia TaxID=40324 RepID=UPI00313A9BCA
MNYLYPATNVHVGGDEAVKDQWEASNQVHHRMRSMRIKEQIAIHSHINKRLETFQEQQELR